MAGALALLREAAGTDIDKPTLKDCQNQEYVELHLHCPTDLHGMAFNK
jgi:hypothetical protein